MEAHIVTHVVPAYACAGQHIVMKDGKAEVVLFVERVVRHWRDEETPETNGSAPCLLYIAGSRFPWYVENGHEYLRVFSQKTTID